MKGFNGYFQRAQIPEWRQHYVNYVALKDCVLAYGKRRRRLGNDRIVELTPLASSSAARPGGDVTSSDEYYRIEIDDNEQEQLEEEDVAYQISKRERDEFQALLVQELQKSNQWYQQELLEDLRQRLQLLLAQEEKESIVPQETTNASTTSLNTTTPPDSSPSWEELAHEFLKTYSFCVANIMAVRQALLRYDGYARTYNGCVLSEWYVLTQQGTSSTSELQELQQQPLLLDLEPLCEMWESELSMHLMTTNINQRSNRFQAQFDEMQVLLDKTWLGVEKAASGHWTKRDYLLSTLRKYFLIGTLRFGISMEPKFLSTKGHHIKREMKSLVKLRERTTAAGELELEPSHSEGDDNTKMDPENVWPLFLNLVSCFLFMMNTYIIEPSSAYYANALGASDALSGILLGMSPWFALVSAIGYSVWTNQSYRTPIMFAGVLMVIGNTLYGVAYSLQSMEIALIGRAIAGLGAPRIINRRYVADATPFALRTISSAAFALTTALGAALGPGVAILLDLIPEFEFNLPFPWLMGRPQTFNGMTGPGFLMAILWFFYVLIIAVSFREPNRSGLEELKRREQEQQDRAEEAQRQYQQETSSSSKVDVFVDDDDDESSMGSTGSKQLLRSTEVSKHSPLYCIKNMTRATALCMSLIFMKRIALESIVGSTSVVTKNRYGWSIQNVGTLQVVNGMIVIPVSIFAGWLSQYYQDRLLALWFMGITALGMALLVDVTDLYGGDDNLVWSSVGPVRYIVGSLIAFSGIESCESFVASLMSKVVPSALAVGTFNSGLLATLVGTSGRAVGDLFITAMALISIPNLLNLLIIPGLALMLLSIFLLLRNYAIVDV